MICEICYNITKVYAIYNKNHYVVGICKRCHDSVPDHIPPSQAKRFLEIERCKRKRQIGEK
jgi:hypothetical protein